MQVSFIVRVRAARRCDAGERERGEEREREHEKEREGGRSVVQETREDDEPNKRREETVAVGGQVM